MAEDLDGTIESMLAPAQTRMQQLGASLNGAGPEAAAAYKSLSSLASLQVDLGRQAAESIGAFRADEAVPSGHRLTEGNERLATVKTMLHKYREGANQAHGQLEAALTRALLPGPSSDPAQRLLHRDSIRTRFGHLDGEHLVAAITRRLGEDATTDGELLSSFGADLLASRDVNPDQAQAIRVQATEAYLKRGDGSRQQAAARKALTTMRELNTVGHLAAFAQAAQLHLSKLDTVSRPSTPESPLTGRDLRV